MNDPQILLELEATTLRPQDASPEAASALTADLALQNLWQHARQQDQNLASAYLAAPLPSDLEADLLRRLRTATRQRAVQHRWRAKAWLALAACLCLLGAVLATLRQAPLEPWQQEALALFDDFEHMRRPLGHAGSRPDDLLVYLRKIGSPEPRRLPDRVKALTSFGCTPVVIAGRRASILCFQLPSGQEAHLAVISANFPSTPAPDGQPIIQKNGPWHHATWQEGGQTFILGTCASKEELRKLLGLC
jgi:hypothetical protein